MLEVKCDLMKRPMLAAGVKWEISTQRYGQWEIFADVVQMKGELKMTSRVTAAFMAAFMLIGGCIEYHDIIIDDPGFRPQAEKGADQLFQGRLGNISITVLLAVIRSYDATEYDNASRDRIAEYLRANNLATVEVQDDQIDLSQAKGSVQWDIFQNGMAIVSDYLSANPIPTEYALLVECLITARRSGGEAVGGIHCYILDAKGQNTFSFLLNSHHRLFVEAQLEAETVSDEARAGLIDSATDVVIEALHRQLGVGD